MADDTGVEVALDVTEANNVLETPEVSGGTSTREAASSPDEPSPSQDDTGHDVKRTASSPTAVGKRAIDDDADEVRKHQTGQELPPRKKARKGSAGTSSPAEDSPSSPDTTSKPAAPGIAVSGLRTSFAQPAAPGPAGVRTSFGTTSQNPVTKANIDFVMHAPLTVDERNQFTAAVRDYESVEVNPLTKRKLEWTIGPIKTGFLVGNTWLEIWESIIDKWCEAFLIDNQANIAQVGLAPSLLKTALQSRLDVKVGDGFPSTFRQVNKILLRNPDTSRLRNFAGAFKPDQEKLAKKQARTAAKLGPAGGDTIQSSTETDRQTEDLTMDASADNSAHPSPPTKAHTDLEQDGGPGAEMEDGEINSGDASGVEVVIEQDHPIVSEAELHQRHRYFPNIPDDAVFCLTCAQVGHATASCPDLTCKFCQGTHFKYECPTRQRCVKCKQLGHAKISCPEKLAVAPGEVAIECAICEGYDHTEINCIQLYQIYRPQPSNVKKVKSLPVFCYACGTEGHYGGDCHLADTSAPPTKVWTISTASLYIDPNSNDVALSYRNELPIPPQVTRPVIPGRSIKPQTHVIFEESDGEGDGDFIHADNGGPPHRNKRNKRSNNAPAIQISSNISFGSNGATGPSHKGPPQPPKKSKKPGNDALPGSKLPGGRRNRNRGPPPQAPQPVNFTTVRTSQPPPQQSRGSGGRGGGNAGRGGGGFSQLNTKRPRRARRGQGGGGGGGQT